ncbi:MAG: tRNA dihydrouridine synthase DusB [Vulcanimicrobiota bacterium]
MNEKSKQLFEIKKAPEFRPFYIGEVKINNPLILAPLAGITDVVFRRIIKSMGTGLVYTEMISCFALHYNNRKTWKIAELSEEEKPVSVQIFGGDPQLMAEAAKRLEDMGASIIDINLGCSVPKVVKSGAGAALCRDLPLLAKNFEAVVSAVKIPVTIKIRKGWSNDEITAPEICKMARECGIKAVAIHGRTSVQKYSGTADWEFIKKMKETANLPIIGNGDIRTAAGARARLEFSGVDGIMIGREAVSNPWIFRESLELMQGLKVDESGKHQNLRELILYHLNQEVERFGKVSGVEKMRKFIAWYTRGLPGSSRFREQIFHIPEYEAVVEEVNTFFHQLAAHRR